MGCQSSKLDLADDSIHVILSHAQQNGQNPAKPGTTYVPRKPHPLMMNNALSAEGPSTTAMESDAESEKEIDRLLYHAAHHNDTIDPRDLAEYGDEKSTDE